jgi:asparagine synthase (glutamine-hydrolysing)
MCGICGHLAPSLDQPVERNLLEKMNRTLVHRGPDSDGFYLNGCIGMAMRRLSIIDIAGGDQPIFNEDESIAVVYNGEIYNFQELRAELKKLGHIFRTRSDTEVIVHAYEEWGDQALLKFNGMFVISLWDERNKRLLLARDRMGKKPLYWHYSSAGLLWGSEAKAVLAAPWVERRVNPIALHHYLTLQYTPDPLSIFENIHKLPAAHKLVAEAGQPPVISRWWKLAFEPKWNISEPEAIEQAQDLLSQAVRRRLISEVPLGAFLSGGIDSSIVVALMAEQLSEPVKTFTIGFEERHFSEAHYARQVAEIYPTDHHEFLFRPADLISVIEEVVSACDEPLADPAALPLYELARQTRQHVTVALCGDGGDETLAGYRRYSLDGLLAPYAALPGWFTQRLVPGAVTRIPEPAWIPEDRNPITGLKRLAQFSATTHKASLVRWGSYFSPDEKLAMYSKQMRQKIDSQDTSAWIASAYDDASAFSQLDRTLYADHVTYLSGDLLPKTDRVTMAHSLEARSPLLDPEWVAWTARLPMHFKVRYLQSKWLLTRAFMDKLPHHIQKRGKQGFSVPVGFWIRNDLKGWTRELLLDRNSFSEWLDNSYIENLLVNHETGRSNFGKKIWSLIIFAVWQNLYLQD